MRFRSLLPYSFSIFLVIICAGASWPAHGQAARWQQSFRAGGVNSLSGTVEVRTSGVGQWKPLSSHLWLGSGFEVRTGRASRVEILLAPGSFLRAGEETEFQLADTSVGRVRIGLVKGSVVVESAGAPVEVETAQTLVRTEGRALVRINELAGGVTEVLTREGVATARASREVKVYPGIGFSVGLRGDAFNLFGTSDRKVDALDNWSRERAQVLAASNRSALREMAASYAAGYEDGTGEEDGEGYEEGLAGAWVFDPRAGGFTFVPFAPSVSSPYGFDYSYVYPVILNPGYSARDWTFDRQAQDLSEPQGFRDRRFQRLRRQGFVTGEPLFTQPFQGNTIRVPGTNMPFEARPFVVNPGGRVAKPPAVFAPRPAAPPPPRP